jgi:hypothetical protein
VKDQVAESVIPNKYHHPGTIFCLQSLWNLGTKNSSGLTLSTYDRLVTSNCLERILSLTYTVAERIWTYSKHISRDRYPASLLAHRSDVQKTQLLYCCLLDRVYRAVDWQRVDQIRYDITERNM